MTESAEEAIARERHELRMRYLASVAGDGPSAPVPDQTPRPGRHAGAPAATGSPRSVMSGLLPSRRPHRGRTSRRTTVVTGLVGLAVGVLLVGVIWTMAGDDGDPVTAAPAANAAANAAAGTSHEHSSAVDPVSSPSVLGTEASKPKATALDGCQEVAAAQAKPLRAAVAAVDQWEIHVGAMNKLIAGAITLDQATAFWDQTRVGADRNVRAFQAANRDYRQGTLSTCPKPDQVANGSSAPLRACARSVMARNTAIQAADTSVSTWGEHVHHMEMLRLGRLSPEKATALWLDSWQAGVRQIDRYQEAVQKMRGHHC